MEQVVEGLEYHRVSVYSHDHSQRARTDTLLALPTLLYGGMWTADGRMVVVVCAEAKLWAQRCCSRGLGGDSGGDGGGEEELGVRVGFEDAVETVHSVHTRILYTTAERLLFGLCNGPIGISVLIVDLLQTVTDRDDTETSYKELLLFHCRDMMAKVPTVRLVVSCAPLIKDTVIGYFGGVRRVVEVECVAGRPEIDILHLRGGDMIGLLNEESMFTDGNVVVFVSGREMGDHIVSRVKNRQLLSFYSGRSQLHHSMTAKYAVVVTTGFTPPDLVIRYVIDCGVVKRRRFNRWCHELVEEPVTQVEADQRLSIINHPQAGKCYRMYGELAVFDCPSITVVDPTMVVVFLLRLGYGEVWECELLNGLHAESVKCVIPYLHYTDVIDDNGALNRNNITKYSVPLPYAVMLEEAARQHLVVPVAKIVSTILSIKASQKRLVIQPNDNLALQEGDHIAMLNIFNAFQSSRSPRWCANNGFNFDILSAASKIFDRLLGLLGSAGVDAVAESRDLEGIRKCIATGLMMNVAVPFVDKSIEKPDHYVCQRTGRRLWTHPDSFLFHRHPQPCIVYDEASVSGDGRIFVKYISVIDPKWLCRPDHAGFWEHTLVRR